MFAERIEFWFEEAARKGGEQGMQQSRREGMEAGLLKGQANTLAELLKLRFGPLSAEAVERLTRATVDRLDAWAEVVLAAPSLSAVFDPSRH
jgi:flagellar biosynthesis/type III secretory pathway protein FliH